MTERPTDLVDAYCRLVVDGAADNEILLAIADRMTDDEKMRAFRRLAYEREIELAMRIREGWFALGGRWLHS